MKTINLMFALLLSVLPAVSIAECKSENLMQPLPTVFPKVEKLMVSPPVIFPYELVKITERVLPPPTPVVFK